MDLQRPMEEGKATHSHRSPLSFLPSQVRQHSFGALGISAEEENIIHKDSDTTAYATFIPPPPPRPNDQKGA